MSWEEGRRQGRGLLLEHSNDAELSGSCLWRWGGARRDEVSFQEKRGGCGLGGEGGSVMRDVSVGEWGGGESAEYQCSGGGESIFLIGWDKKEQPLLVYLREGEEGEEM